MPACSRDFLAYFATIEPLPKEVEIYTQHPLAKPDDATPDMFGNRGAVSLMATRPVTAES